MRKAKRYQPQIENLESMTLLAGVFAGMHGPAASIATLAIPEHRRAGVFLHLDGELSGTYQVMSGIPDVGNTYRLSGDGLINPLGKAHGTGDFNQVGNVARGRARGQIALTTSRGSLTLTFRGPLQKGFAPLPYVFLFKITSGSGAYLRDRGHGIAILLIGLPIGQPSPRADHHGFTLALLP